MKKWLLFGLVSVPVALWVAARSFSPKEPVHQGKKASAWIRQLAQAQPNVAAENALAEMGSAAVPHLIKALRDEESLADKWLRALSPEAPTYGNRYLLASGGAGLRRLRAAAVLGRIGPSAANAVPPLIRLLAAEYVAGRRGTNTLRAPDQFLRQEAATALKKIGIAGGQAAPGLTDLLAHRDFRVRWIASELLVNVQPPVAKEYVLGLAAALRSEDDRSRQNILAALKRCQSDSEMAWPNLLANLRHTNDAIRACAAETLSVIAPATAEVATSLEQAMHDEQPGVRLEAAHALWKNTKVQDASMTRLLVDTLKDEKPFWRRKAARYLGEMGSLVRAAIPALGATLKDPDLDTRLQAARAITQIDPDLASLAVPVLTDALIDRSPRRRSLVAAQMLGELGARARAAVPALAEVTDEAAAPIAAAASEALEKIQPGLLAKLRRDPQYKRELVMPELIRVLKGTPEVRGFAFQALKRFGWEAREVVPDMLAALQEPELKNPRFDWVWIRAFEAFSAIGPAASNAVPMLLSSVNHPTVSIRSGAVYALGRIGLITPEVTAALTRALEDDEPVVRAYAARSLGAFGPAAKGALPALERALRSEELQLHAMAMAEAIRKIDPEDTELGQREPGAKRAEKR